MGLFSGLRKGASDEDRMAAVLSEVSGQSDLAAAMRTETAETWHFPDELEMANVNSEGGSLDPILSPPVTEVTDRRSLEDSDPVGSLDEILEPYGQPSPAADSPDPPNGPVGAEAEQMLASFGLTPGSTWSELQSAYLEIKSSCDPVMATGPEDEGRFQEVLIDANVIYARLRLTAVD